MEQENLGKTNFHEPQYFNYNGINLIKTVLGAFEFILPERYSTKELIGFGSFGAVAEAYDNVHKRIVAIKKIQNMSDQVDLKRIIREIVILKNLKHENIIKLYDVIFIKHETKIGDVYLIFEKMDTDLFKIIKSQQNLSSDHFKFILYQLLRAVLYLHSADIIHRDIKPSNVLISEDCTIKLCDFGLSRGINSSLKTDLTEYVVTRFYRAPEIMLCSHNYTKAIDVWSIGCTFGELLSQYYLFPGNNYLDQIKVIIDKLGSISDEDLDFIQNDQARNFVKGFVNIPPKNLAKYLKCDDNVAIDLLSKMIVFNPKKRLSVESCLSHPYITSIKESNIIDPVYEGVLNFDFEIENIDSKTLVNLLEKEIYSYESGKMNITINK